MKFIIEDFLDPEKQFYDYKTKEIKNDQYIDLDKFSNTETEYLYKQIKDGQKPDMKADIVYMSPREYLEATSYIFNHSYQDELRQMRADNVVINHLADVIKIYNRMYPLPHINYTSTDNEGRGSQEGRHRLYTLGKLFGFDKKYPILIISYKDPAKQLQKYKTEIRDKDIDNIHEILDEYLYETNNWKWDYSDLMFELDDIEYKLHKFINEDYNYELKDTQIDSMNDQIILTYDFGPYSIKYFIDTLDLDNVKINNIEVN